MNAEPSEQYGKKDISQPYYYRKIEGIGSVQDLKQHYFDFMARIQPFVKSIRVQSGQERYVAQVVMPDLELTISASLADGIEVIANSAGTQGDIMEKSLPELLKLGHSYSANQ